jgi:sodium/proline symporter
VMIGLGYLGSPQLFVRYMSARDEATLDKGKWVAVTMQFLMNFSAVSIGVLGRLLLTSPGQAPSEVLGNGAQEVMIRLVESVLPAFLSGFYIAAVLSAIMSTVDSLLIVASSAVVRDFYQQTYHPELGGEKLARLSRWATIFLSALSLAIALSVAFFSPTRTVFWFVIFGWSGIAASFCPVILLSLFWKKYTANGALGSMLAGFLSVPIFKFLAPELPLIGPYFKEIAELMPSFVVALVVGVVFSKFDGQKKKRSAWAIPESGKKIPNLD